MKIKTVTIGVLAGAIFGMAAHAGNDNAALTLAKKSVVSKAYADDSFQTKIPATASGLTQMFGGGGTLVAATGTDGVVAPRLILPGYRDAQSEFGLALSQQSNDYGYWALGVDEYSAMIDDMYAYVTGEQIPYVPKYSIPSLELVKDLTDVLYDRIESLKIPAAPSGLTQMFGGGGTLVAATGTDGVVAPRLIIGGYRNGQTNELAWAIQQQKHDYLYDSPYGSISMDEWAAMVDDMYLQATGEHLPYDGRYSVPSIELLVELINMLNDKKQENVSAHAANAADSVLTDSATAGTVQKRAIYDGGATYVAGTHGTQIPTMAGVAAYVETHSPTIPAPTGDCLNAANHCALVTTYANGAITYAWTVMAK